MKSTFANVALNTYDRNFGGTKIGIADPYISGYHFIDFILPPKLGEMFNKSHKPIEMGIADAQNVLNGSALSVTVPGGTMNKTDMNGLGGTKWSVPTSMDYGNTLSIRFLEYSHLPILSIFHTWFRMIRDFRTGTASDALVGENYSKEHYAGSLFYWTTKPDGVTVEYASFYTGVFPTKDPQDLFGADLNTIDKVEMDMEFSVDWVWQEPFVYEKCTQKALERKNTKSLHIDGKDFHGSKE